jgi:enolase
MIRSPPSVTSIPWKISVREPPRSPAAAAGVPLWRYLVGPKGAALPLPEIQIFGGGAHAGRRIDVQDFMVVCPGASSFAQALNWTAEVYRAAGALMAELEIM